MKLIIRVFLYVTFISSIIYFSVFYQIKVNKRFDENGVVTNGIVVDFSSSRSENSTYFYPIIEFTDYKGRKIEFASKESDNTIKKGESIAIKYIKDSPREARVNSVSNSYNLMYIGGFFAALALIFLGVDTFKRIQAKNS